MKIPEVNNPTENMNFGVLQNYKTLKNKTVVTGKIKNTTVDIYTRYHDNGDINYKLYYIKKANEWIRSKLKYFKGNKVYQIIRGEANGTNS